MSATAQIHRPAQKSAANSQPTGREKRVAPRVSCQLIADYEHRGFTARAHTHDLSASGCAVVIERGVELGEVVSLELRLPSDDQPVACAGLVRGWRTVQGHRIVGLEFHKLHNEDRRRLARFVRDRLNAAASEGPGARSHWVHTGIGTAASWLASARSEEDLPVLRWAPGMKALFAEVSAHLSSQENLFVPCANPPVEEGQRLLLRVVVPGSHVRFDFLCEVVWVQPLGTDKAVGVGLRFGGLTEVDRGMLAAANTA